MTSRTGFLTLERSEAIAENERAARIAMLNALALGERCEHRLRRRTKLWLMYYTERTSSRRERLIAVYERATRHYYRAVNEYQNLAFRLIRERYLGSST